MSATPHVSALTAEEALYWRWVGAMDACWRDIGKMIGSHVGNSAIDACRALAVERDRYHDALCLIADGNTWNAKIEAQYALGRKTQ